MKVRSLSVLKVTSLSQGKKGDPDLFKFLKSIEPIGVTNESFYMKILTRFDSDFKSFR